MAKATQVLSWEITRKSAFQQSGQLALACVSDIRVHLCVQAAVSSVHACTNQEGDALRRRAPSAFPYLGLWPVCVLCGSERTPFITTLASQGLSLKKSL